MTSLPVMSAPCARTGFGASIGRYSMSPRPSSRSAPPMSRIVRESTCELTAKAMREGMFALMMPVMTSTDGRCVATIEMDAGRARELREPHDRRFDLRRRDQHEVGEFVDDDHDVGQLFVGDTSRCILRFCERRLWRNARNASPSLWSSRRARRRPAAHP